MANYDPDDIPESLNGGTILTLGILSLLCCGCILGPITYIMAESALNRIGKRQHPERGVIEAGKKCALVAMIIYGFLLLMKLMLANQSQPYH